ncbi:hypothetical protein C9374_004268 [Naegleria lovaniensis]|uniref:Uncharacterized protein n=1 Tax=Naegleria lovaniensis TaxID=51637 RepID=A0AA88KJV1_NAELO|nr:uncharacterized protein C9374_004268 [Naegleria lovaniensis]KAG2383597.1 hypothetical protein C9374_004268 [Naegleria lovaniensis]
MTTRIGRRRRNNQSTMMDHSSQHDFPDPHEPNIHFTLFHMLRIIHWEIIWILIGMIGFACLGAMPIIFNILMGELINSIFTALSKGGEYASQIQTLSVWMAIIAALACVTTSIGAIFMTWSFERVGVRFKTAYISSLLRQEIGFFDMKRTGQLMSWMTESMEQIQDSFSNKLGRATQFTVQVLLGIILAIVFAWKMALAMIAFAPVIAFIMFISAIASQKVTKRTLAISTRASGIANEVIGSMRTVRSMDAEEKEISRYEKTLESGKYIFLLKSITLGGPIGSQELSIWGILAFGMWWGGQLLLRGEIEFGNMFRVFTLLLMSVLGCSQIMATIPDLTRAIQSGKNIVKVIQRIPAMRSSGGIAPSKLIGHLEFKNVSFAYPTRPNTIVLKNFSLSIQPGQSVAFVGGSGSGKSTLIGLLEKFYEPLSGEILIDGKNITEIDPRWLHRNIGIVTQEPTLFATTIRDNICYAVRKSDQDPYPSDEEMINAAKIANAHEFISNLPDGYNTPLGEKGVSLSGGQKQRICIARAVIQNPSVLLLDEATSALDTNSESIVQDALNKLMKGRTCIVVAHRLSTIVDSDVICVLQKGELKETGRHDELLHIKDGHYAALVQKQLMKQSASVESIMDEEDGEVSEENDGPLVECVVEMNEMEENNHHHDAKHDQNASNDSLQPLNNGVKQNDNDE